MPKKPLTDIAHEPQFLRTLVHEPDYLKAIEEVFETVQRADDVLGGLELFISRRAEMGMACKGYPPEFCTWLSTLLPNDCRVRVLYTYTTEEAHLLDAWMVSGSADGPYYR